jgi:hypothetical protein
VGNHSGVIGIAPGTPAIFLRRTIKVIEINGLPPRGAACAQSYQQNVGISWHNFCNA